MPLHFLNERSRNADTWSPKLELSEQFKTSGRFMFAPQAEDSTKDAVPFPGCSNPFLSLNVHSQVADCTCTLLECRNWVLQIILAEPMEAYGNKVHLVLIKFAPKCLPGPKLLPQLHPKAGQDSSESLWQIVSLMITSTMLIAWLKIFRALPALSSVLFLFLLVAACSLFNS